MRTLKLLACGLTALLTPLAAAATTAAQGPAPAMRPAMPLAPVKDRYIVVYEPHVDVDAETDRNQRAHGFRARFRYRTALRGFAARLTPGQLRALRRDPDVESITPDRVVHARGFVPLASGEPTPPPGIRRIQAATPTAAREPSDSAVAVIDTGIDLTHPDLNAIPGKNCVTSGAAPADDEGHGTHVAGSIAARNNGSGVVGAAPGTPVYAVKVLDSRGDGEWSQIICGIDWVTANAGTLDIGVANMSLGGLGTADDNRDCGAGATPLHEAICASTRAGVLYVVAAGNDGWSFDHATQPDVPSSYPEVLTVTAMADTDGIGGASGPNPRCRKQESDDRYASFSNFATSASAIAHTIAAPGVCVVSTRRGGGTETLSGTSMASPHAAGVAALCIGEAGTPGPCAGDTPAEMINRLRADASAYTDANTTYGFNGDPLRPRNQGQHYGYLIRTPPGPPDIVPPDTSIVSGPSGLTSDPTPTFTFTSDEAAATFECRIGGGAWAACSSPHTTTTLSDGAHTFEVRAKDAAGNIDATPASRAFTVDTTAPDTSITDGPSGTTSDPTPAFSFQSPDTTATFECRIDTGAWQTCTSPHTTATLGDGAHTFTVRAKDPAGNIDATPASRSFTVDTTPPTTSIGSGPSGLTSDATPTFTFTSDDASATFECRTDSGGWETCTSPHTTTALSDGSHTFEVRAKDPAGNVDASPASRTFTVDATAPDTSITDGPSGATSDPTPAFSFESPDTTATFECRIDTGAWDACTSPDTTTTLTDGAHTFEVRATDAAGNTETTPASREFTVDTSPPDTSITGGPSGATSDPTPAFSFESPDTTATFECRIDTGAWETCTSPHTTNVLSDGTHTFDARATDAAGNTDATPASRTFTVDTAPAPATPTPEPEAEPTPTPSPTADAEPTPATSPTAAANAESAPPELTLSVRRQRLRAAVRRGVNLRVAMSEAGRACSSLRIRLRAARRLRLSPTRADKRRRAVVLGSRCAQFAESGSRTVRVRFKRRARRAIARRARRNRRLTVVVRVVAVDSAGDKSKERRRVRLSR